MDYLNFEVSSLKFKQFCKKPFFKLSFLAFLCLNVACSPICCAEELSHQAMVKSAEKVLADIKVNKNHWYPSYHFNAGNAHLVELSALGFYKGKYHLFYQENFNKDDKSYSMWGHVESEDLFHWKKLPSALVPYSYYDNSGISGGSMIVDNDMFYIFYTGKGVSEPPSEEQKDAQQHDKKISIVSTQNLATSKDGLYFGRSANNPVIKAGTLKNKHEFSSDNFSNPYVWKNGDSFYALVGAQYKKTKDGAVLLYKSADLRNWEAVNVTAIGQNGEAGYMWENPSFFNVNGFDVLNISPKGVKPHKMLFLNKNQTGAFVGKLDYKTGKFVQQGAFMPYDYGFDFYSPKFVKNADGKVICLAFLGMEGTDKPEKSDNWSGLATIPREVKIVNGKLHTTPAKEVQDLRLEKTVIHHNHFNGEKDLVSVKSPVFELDTTLNLSHANKITIKLKYDVSNELVLSYDKEAQILKLDRNKAGGGLSGVREASLPLYENKLYLRIFSDKSSVEIFANNGPVAMSTRVYPDKPISGVKFVSDGDVTVEKMELYKLKSVE